MKIKEKKKMNIKIFLLNLIKTKILIYLKQMKKILLQRIIKRIILKKIIKTYIKDNLNGKKKLKKN